MPTSSNPVPVVHLHWVRESPERELVLPISSTLSTLDDLPPSARAAVVASRLPELELHLPPFRPYLHEDPGAWLAALEYRFDGPNRLIGTHPADPDPIATMGFHHAVLLLFRAFSADTTPLTLVAEPCPSVVIPPAPTRYHTVSPRPALAAAPGERTRHYRRVYRRISLAFQAAIRESFPPCYIDSPSLLGRRQRILPVIAWSAAVPSVGRTVDEISLDIFDTRQAALFFRRLPRRLGSRLRPVHQAAIRHEVTPHIRGAYNPNSARTVTSACRRRTLQLNRLFSSEMRLILAFIGFLTRIPDWLPRAASRPDAVYREICRAWARLEILFRSFHERRSNTAFGSLLLLEAVRTLEEIE